MRGMTWLLGLMVLWLGYTVALSVTPPRLWPWVVFTALWVSVGLGALVAWLVRAARAFRSQVAPSLMRKPDAAARAPQGE